MQKNHILLLVLAFLRLGGSTPYGGFGNSDPALCTTQMVADNIFMWTELNQQGECWMTFTAQYCVDELADLHDDPNSRIVDGQPKNFLGSVDNECEVRVEGQGEQIYDFTLYIDNEFNIDHGANPFDCFSHGVTFKEYDLNTVPEHAQVAYVLGNQEDDPYDPNIRGSIFSPQPGDDPQLVRFSIDFEDLESVYGCTKTTDPNQYVWICIMEYTIYFAGLPQYIYQFKMQSVLPRSVDASLQVSITKNTVEGDCCTNTLGINSQLEFCLNYDCELEDINGNQTGVQGFETVNGIKTITRLEIFYVAHCIATEEFKNYRLIGQSLTLNGVFAVTVHNSKELSINGYGCFVWEASSAIALPIMQIVAVSKLERPLRRELSVENFDLGNVRLLSAGGAPDLDENGEPNDQYNVKGENQMSIGGGISLEDDVYGDEPKIQKTQYSQILVFGLLNILLVFFLF